MEGESSSDTFPASYDLWLNQRLSLCIIIQYYEKFQQEYLLCIVKHYCPCNSPVLAREELFYLPSGGNQLPRNRLRNARTRKKTCKKCAGGKFLPLSVAGQITVYFHADYKLRAVLTCIFCISLGQFCSRLDLWVLRECKIVALCGLCMKLKEVKSFTWWFKLIRTSYLGWKA